MSVGALKQKNKSGQGDPDTRLAFLIDWIVDHGD